MCGGIIPLWHDTLLGSQTMWKEVERKRFYLGKKQNLEDWGKEDEVKGCVCVHTCAQERDTEIELERDRDTER